MKASKIASFIICLFISAFMFAQHNLLQDIPVKKDSCDVNFKSSITTSDLELFAKCISDKSSIEVPQSTLLTDQINFKKLPLLLVSEEFPTVQNINSDAFIELGNYNSTFINMKTNNLALFEASRNSILSSGYSNYSTAPQF
ncbi:hypothetical protein [Nonlabens sp. Asnod3-A02]|uniref:hypothetical protein n=1 Tax=Nonlabens sp. Asnod3-A02 TaxID=3160579 RepID=UPI00386836C0